MWSTWSISERVQKLFEVWKFSTFQVKMPFFKLYNANGQINTHLPTKIRIMLRMTKEMKSTITLAFYATLPTQGKLGSTLTHSSSILASISWHFLQSLGFSGAIEAYKGENVTVNSTGMPAKKLKFVPEKFACEVRVVF